MATTPATARDSIDAAIQSAESLFASLLDRPPSREGGPELSLAPSIPPPSAAGVDPEASVCSVGMLSLGPAQLTAHAHIALPELLLKDVDPLESLKSFVSRQSVASMPEPPEYDTVYRMLQEREKDLELAAEIGQVLLQRNNVLEVDLSSALDRHQQCEQELAQLHHELTRKEELLHLYMQDAREKEGEQGKEMEKCDEIQDLSLHCKHLQDEKYQVSEENELLKDQLSEMQESQGHLTCELQELLEKYEECSMLLQEKQNELQSFMDISEQNDVESYKMQRRDGNDQHESIVQEIEEVLRKELIAASTLPERPPSPNNYARQRTMVVMETVRAATLATARRYERLAQEAAATGKGKKSTEEELGSSSSSKDNNLEPNPSQPQSSRRSFSPLATSSPLMRHRLAVSRGSGGGGGGGGEGKGEGGGGVLTSKSFLHSKPPPPSSPHSSESDAGSTASLPDDFMRHRNQKFFSPQKLQIVKPMEGSVTLLKWKLLASPQLGGATSYFSDVSTPGVHMKKWRASGVRDSEEEMMAESLRKKSQSVMDLSSTGMAAASSGRKKQSRGSRYSSEAFLSVESAYPQQLGMKKKKSSVDAGPSPSPGRRESGLNISLQAPAMVDSSKTKRSSSSGLGSPGTGTGVSSTNSNIGGAGADDRGGSSTAADTGGLFGQVRSWLGFGGSSTASSTSTASSADKLETKRAVMVADTTAPKRPRVTQAAQHHRQVGGRGGGGGRGGRGGGGGDGVGASAIHAEGLGSLL